MKFHQQKLIVFILSIIGLINCVLPFWKISGGGDNWHWEGYGGSSIRVVSNYYTNVFDFTNFGIIIFIIFIVLLALCFINRKKYFEGKFKVVVTIGFMILFLCSLYFSYGHPHAKSSTFSTTSTWGKNSYYVYHIGLWLNLSIGLVGSFLMFFIDPKRMKSISSAPKLQHTPILTQKDIAYERQKEIEQQKKQEEIEREREKQDKRVGTIIIYVSIVILVATIFVALYRTILSI